MSFAVLGIEPSDEEFDRKRRLRPKIPEHSKAPNIDDTEMAGRDPIRTIAKSPHKHLPPCDFTGLNVRRLYLPILVVAFRRVDIKFKLAGRLETDVQQISRTAEPGALEAAARKKTVDVDRAHTGRWNRGRTLEEVIGNGRIYA